MSEGDREKAAEIERLAAREKRIEARPDGSLSVRLLEVVSLTDTESGAVSERASVSVRPAKVRDLRRAHRAIHAGDNASDAYADQIVEPDGVYDEIANAEDQQTVREAVDRQLGKFLGTGREP